MSELPAVRPLYVCASPQPVFAVLHPRAAETSPRPAVLLLPPFGWEDVCSYRSRRDWAEQLAWSGHPTLRIDLPGTGDSAGGPFDPDLMDAWTGAVAAATRWLRDETGAPIAAVGLGLGGLLACLAARRGAPIEQLVLWGVPAQGRRLVRELRAFARLEAAAFAAADGPEVPPLPEGVTQAGGFILADETRTALEEIDLASAEGGWGELRRALLLDRDGLPPDAALGGTLERAGVAVTMVPGRGWAAMMEEPQDARPPREVFRVVEDWLDDTTSTPRAHAATVSPAAGDEALLGDSVRERPLLPTQPFGRLFGVLSENRDGDAGLCAVLLNAGAVRRIGPNRMWVELARRWAARGVPTLRLDVEGLGDADGDAAPHYEAARLNTFEYVAQVRAAMDELEARGLGPRFVLLGLCAGGFQAFHVAASDRRVVAALMVNPGALIWDPSLPAQRQARRMGRRIIFGTSWRELPWRHALPRALSLARSLLLVALCRLRRRAPDGVTAMLEQLGERGVRVLFAFGFGEPLHEELERSGVLGRAEEWPGIDVIRIPGAVHTLRPLALQRHVHALLDRELDALLAVPR